MSTEIVIPYRLYRDKGCKDPMQLPVPAIRDFNPGGVEEYGIIVIILEEGKETRLAMLAIGEAVGSLSNLILALVADQRSGLSFLAIGGTNVRSIFVEINLQKFIAAPAIVVDVEVEGAPTVGELFFAEMDTH